MSVLATLCARHKNEDKEFCRCEQRKLCKTRSARRRRESGANFELRRPSRAVVKQQTAPQIANKSKQCPKTRGMTGEQRAALRCFEYLRNLKFGFSRDEKRLLTRVSRRVVFAALVRKQRRTFLFSLPLLKQDAAEARRPSACVTLARCN